MGVYNWGIYTGYSLSYALGNFITNANINNQGWRWSFIIAGIPGILLGFVILVTVREPKRPNKKVIVAEMTDDTPMTSTTSEVREKLKQMTKLFRPSILLLCLASSIRNAAGYVWAYNTQVYFDELGQTPSQIGSWMSWVPIVGGSIGIMMPMLYVYFTIQHFAITGPFVDCRRYFRRLHLGPRRPAHRSSRTHLGFGSESNPVCAICCRRSFPGPTLLLY